jgi:hypothetical protein
VKAGIDFSNFDTKHMNYISDKNLIRLYRHQPEIISATINPWFIPEKQIKGFEYLFISQKLREGDDAQSVQQSTQLKQECLDMLQDDARHAGILEHARENAETVLSNFFSLILDKEIKVEIYGSKLEPYLNGLLAKKKLSGLDLVMIDSVVGRFLKEDTVGTREFLREAYDSLTMPEPWPAANKNLRISAFYYQVSDDEFLSKKEQDSLAYVTSDTSVSYRDMLYYSIVDAKADRKAVKANKVYDLEALKTKVGSLRKEPDPNIKP